MRLLAWWPGNERLSSNENTTPASEDAVILGEQ